jgi:hypothetical protein
MRCDNGQYKVVGLELGADDFIVKPFGVIELLALILANGCVVDYIFISACGKAS